jgi:hypothetical protein
VRSLCSSDWTANLRGDCLVLLCCRFCKIFRFCAWNKTNKFNVWKKHQCISISKQIKRQVDLLHTQCTFKSGKPSIKFTSLFTLKNSINILVLKKSQWWAKNYHIFGSGRLRPFKELGIRPHYTKKTLQRPNLNICHGLLRRKWPPLSDTRCPFILYSFSMTKMFIVSY